jgi:hypothetical protein
MSKIKLEFENDIFKPPKIVIKDIINPNHFYDFALIDYCKGWIVWYVNHVHGDELLREFVPYMNKTGTTFMDYMVHVDYEQKFELPCKLYTSGYSSFDTMEMIVYLFESNANTIFPEYRTETDEFLTCSCLYSCSIDYVNPYHYVTSASTYKCFRPQNSYFR